MSENYYQTFVRSIGAKSIPFNSYDSSLHDEPEQLKRRINASKIKSENITDCDEYYRIQGSSGSEHIASSEHCTCFDYASRNMPCKHIYRYALDHSMISELPKIKPRSAKAFSEKIDSEIEHFLSYYKQGLISAEKFVKIADAIKKGK